MSLLSGRLDTSTDVEVEQVRRWMEMSPSDRFDAVAALNATCERMAAAGIRMRHPHASPDEVRLRVFALRLGRDLMVRVYSWDPHLEGW